VKSSSNARSVLSHQRKVRNRRSIVLLWAKAAIRWTRRPSKWAARKKRGEESLVTAIDAVASADFSEEPLTTFKNIEPSKQLGHALMSDALLAALRAVSD
jgi:hypothetical protein